MSGNDDELLTGLVSGNTQTADQIKAIVNQLRAKGQLADLAQMSGDSALAPFGAKVNAMNQANEVELGRNAMQNKSDDIRNKNYQRELDQGQATLAETIRYHNMLDQERKDKLAQAAKDKSDLESAQSTIDKIGHYELPLPTNRSARNAAIIDEVSRQYPDYDATKYDAKKKTEKDFSSGPQGNMVRAAPVSLQHLDLADTKAEMLHNTNFPWYNAARNTIGPILGNQDITKGVAGLDTAKTIVSDEIDKFFINGGGAEKDRQHLQDRLQNVNSPTGLHEVTNTLRQLMAGQMNGLRSQYEDNTGRDFLKDHVKDPSVLQVLGWDGGRFTGIPGKPGAAPPAATAGAGAPPGAGSGPPGSAVPGGPGAVPQPIAAPGPRRVKVDAQGNVIGN